MKPILFMGLIFMASRTLQQYVTPDDRKIQGDIVFPTSEENSEVHTEDSGEVQYHKCCPPDKVLDQNYNCINSSEMINSTWQIAVTGFPEPCEHGYDLPFPNVHHEILQDGRIFFPGIGTIGSLHAYCLDHMEGLDFQVGLYCFPRAEENNEINYHKCCPTGKILRENFDANQELDPNLDCINPSEIINSTWQIAVTGFPEPCERPFSLPNYDVPHELLQDGRIYFPLLGAIGSIDNYCLDHVEGLDFQGVYCLPPPRLISEACPNHTCIPQCCESMAYLTSDFSCIPHFDPNSTYYPKFYDHRGNEVDAPLYDDFFQFPDSCPKPVFDQIEFGKNPSSIFYLQTDGRVYFPSWDKYINIGTYCLALNDKGNEVLATCVPEDTEDTEITDHWLYPTTVALMFVSIIFLVVTIAIFIKFPHHGQRGTAWNLHRRICVAYSASLLCAYVFYTISRLTYLFYPGDNFCTFIGVASHFFILSAFFWLNSMCFDMVWTISSMTSQSHSVLKLFIRYCLYSFGVPSILVIVSLVFHFVSSSQSSFQDLTYATTHCFLNSSELAQWLFLYGPAAALFLLNLLFFVRTAVYLFLHSATMTKKATIDKGKQKYTFWLYLRLFLIMGITWVTEVLSWQLSTVHGLTTVNHWAFTDLLNSLQGLFIFLVFVIGSKKQREGLQNYVKGEKPVTRLPLPATELKDVSFPLTKP